MCTFRLRDRGQALQLRVNKHLQPTPCYQAHLFTQDSPPGAAPYQFRVGGGTPGLSAHPQGAWVSAPCPPPTGWGCQGAFSPDNWHKVPFNSVHHPACSLEPHPTVPQNAFPGRLPLPSVCGSGARCSHTCVAGILRELQTSSRGAGTPPGAPSTSLRVLLSPGSGGASWESTVFCFIKKILFIFGCAGLRCHLDFSLVGASGGSSAVVRSLL